MLNLARTEPEEPASAPAEPPQVFVRVFSTPAGAPWDQQRAAQLEARHGAPLPITDLLHRLRRMNGWSPGNPGRFAVFYIRASEFVAPFETVVEVDGTPVTVAFGSKPAPWREMGAAGGLAAAVALSLVLGATGLTMAMGASAEATAHLERVEQRLEVKRRAALAAQRRAREARDLRVAVGRGRPIGDVMTDLAWASAAKAPDARIDAVHWDRGLLAVEARGAAPPLAATDRPLQKSDRPIRPGVWLWGVSLRDEAK